MSVRANSAVKVRSGRVERFDAALMSAAYITPVALWAAGTSHGVPGTVGAVIAGAVTLVLIVAAQVRVGLVFHEGRRFTPVGLLLVAVPIWVSAAVLAATNTALAVPFTMVTGVLLTAALTRPRISP